PRGGAGRRRRPSAADGRTRRGLRRGSLLAVAGSRSTGCLRARPASCDRFHKRASETESTRAFRRLQRARSRRMKPTPASPAPEPAAPTAGTEKEGPATAPPTQGVLSAAERAARFPADRSADPGDVILRPSHGGGSGHGREHPHGKRLFLLALTALG